MTKELVPFRGDSSLRRVMDALAVFRIAGELTRKVGRTVQRKRRRPQTLSRIMDDAQRLRDYRPSFHTSGGLITYHLRRLYKSRSGKARAEYEGRWKDRATGVAESEICVYGIRNGLPVLLFRK